MFSFIFKSSTKVFIFFILMFFSPSIIYANQPELDYNYQLTQYRSLYSQYQILKKDYQENPTLDNQQKALQAAKQAIIAREKSKASYARLFLSSINSQQVDHPYLEDNKQKLLTIINYYDNQAQLADNISTLEELTAYTQEYLESQETPQNDLIFAQPARKIATLIRLQLNTKNAFDSLSSRLPTPAPALVTTGLSQIAQLGEEINQAITATIDLINQSEVTFYSKNTFFNKQIEQFTKIKNLQLKLINALIDLDLNYAQ